MKLIPDILMGKEQFLIEHNKLSPTNLQATFALLTRFQEEKKPLLKDTEWSNKLRIPFISWLLALPQQSPLEKNKRIRKSRERGYKIYPGTK